MGTVLVPPAGTGIVVGGTVVVDGAVTMGALVVVAVEPEPPQAVRTALLTTSNPTNRLFCLMSPGYAARPNESQTKVLEQGLLAADIPRSEGDRSVEPLTRCDASKTGGSPRSSCGSACITSSQRPTPDQADVFSPLSFMMPPSSPAPATS